MGCSKLIGSEELNNQQSNCNGMKKKKNNKTMQQQETNVDPDQAFTFRMRETKRNTKSSISTFFFAGCYSLNSHMFLHIRAHALQPNWIELNWIELFQNVKKWINKWKKKKQIECPCSAFCIYRQHNHRQHHRHHRHGTSNERSSQSFIQHRCENKLVENIIFANCRYTSHFAHAESDILVDPI